MDRKTDTLANRLFQAHTAYTIILDDLEDKLGEIFGPELDYDYLTHDWYDFSFELKKVRGDWVPPPEQLTKAFGLGFDRCWICYDNGDERYCFKEPRAKAPTIGIRRVRRPTTEAN